MVPSVTVAPPTVDAAGKATVVATVRVDGVPSLTLTLTATLDRRVRLEVSAVDGLPLTDFQAWSKT